MRFPTGKKAIYHHADLNESLERVCDRCLASLVIGSPGETCVHCDQPAAYVTARTQPIGEPGNPDHDGPRLTPEHHLSCEEDFEQRR
jgi:hypothetical protein